MAIATAVFVSLALAEPGFAAAKPPKSLCFLGLSATYNLATKKGGTIQGSEGKVAFYTIQGTIQSGSLLIPISGSGHMEGDVFHFSYDGTYHSGIEQAFTHEEGRWDVVNDAGERVLRIFVTFLSGSTSGDQFTVAEVPCSEQTIFSTLSAGQPAESPYLSPAK